jgi:flagella basal body P-ring formation protein FlgA
VNPQLDVSAIPGVREDEVVRLHQQRITTTQDLWKQLGRDPEHGIAHVAATTRIEPTRLLQLIREVAIAEARRCGSPWLVRHTMDVAIALACVLAVVLVLRAAGRLPLLPAGLAVTGRVPVAALPLRAGAIVRAGDIAEVPLPMQPSYVRDKGLLVGTMLQRGVRARQPFRSTDLLRPQVVASTDIASNTVVPLTALAMAWTTYIPSGLTKIEDAVGKRTLIAVRKGQTLESAFLEPGLMPSAK